MSQPFRRILPRASFCRIALVVLAAALLPIEAFAQNGTVTGSISNSATAAPVPGGFVTFCTESGESGSSCSSAGSNASGQYTRSLAPGTYYAYTSNTGLVNEIFNNLPCPGSACQSTDAVATGTAIVVTAGATTPNIDFALDPGGSISGTVTDAATDAPIQGVFVQVYTRVAGQTRFVGTAPQTNAAGSYSLAGLPTGTYYAQTQNTVGYTNEIYDDILCPGNCSSTIAVQSGTAIPVLNGQVTTGRNFTLDVGGTITGTVLNAQTSAPAQSVSISVYTRIGDSISFAASASTNASGVYTVRGLPTATYYVATSASSGLNLLNEIYNGVQCPGFCSPNLPNPGTPVPVTQGATTAGIDFQLDPGGSISGTITDAGTALPLQNVGVSIYRQVGTSGTSFVSSGFTNASGLYTASGLPSGSYFAVTSATTHTNEVYDNIQCPGSCQLTSTILSGTPIAVVAGSVTADRDFALASGGSLAGMVTNAATSAPLSNVSVNVYSRVGNSSVFSGSASTNSTGEFVVSGLPSGDYFAYTSAATSLRLTHEIYNNIPCATFCSSTTATSTGTPIGVTVGNTTTGINFGLATSTSVPSAPSNFGATVDAFVARFSWSAPPSGAVATSYLIEAGVAPGTTIVTFPTTGTSIDIPGVPPGTFYVRVRAVNQFGMGPPSNEFVVVVNPDGSGRLTAPQSFVARINGGRLTVTWADPQFGGVPTSYQLEVGTAAGLSNVASLPIANRSFTYLPVPNGVYFIRVRSRNGMQLSPPSAEMMLVVGNVPSPPEAPRNLFHSLSGSTLTLNWSVPFFGTPTSYVIEAGSESGLSDIAVFNTGNAGLSATFTGVPPGTYYVRVRALNALGASVASAERTIVVP